MNDKTKRTLKIAIPVLILVLAAVLAICLTQCKDEQTPADPSGATKSTQQTNPGESTEPSTPDESTKPTESGNDLPAVDPTASTVPVSDETTPSEETRPTTTGEPQVQAPSLYNPDGTPELPTGKPDTNNFDIPGFTQMESAATGSISDDLRLAAIGSYTGAYMEDGSGDAVENVLALVLENTGDELIEYAQISAETDNTPAFFQITAIPAGGYVLVLESNRQTLSANAKVQSPKVEQIAYVNDLILDYSNEFELYNADGVINLKNVSGKDYENDIFVYYKTFQYDVYLGGVTYRARFEGGVKDGAIAQNMQPHYSGEHSVVVYMAYDE